MSIKENLKNIGENFIRKSTYLVQETPEEAYWNQIDEMNQAEKQLRKLPSHDVSSVMESLINSKSDSGEIYRLLPSESERTINKIIEVYSYLLTSSGEVDGETGPHCPVNYTDGFLTSPDFFPRSTIKLNMTGYEKFDLSLTETGRMRPPSIWRKILPLPIVYASEFSGNSEKIMTEETFLKENVSVSIINSRVSNDSSTKITL